MITGIDGFYLLEVRADIANTITFTHPAYQPLAVDKLVLQTNETRVFNPVLNLLPIEIQEVEIRANRTSANAFVTSISMDSLADIPGANPGVENLLNLLPGVSSDNELSTQFRVRGGNFDENLVYVNGIEVYRPFLIRSAQQEGLSFLNSQLISRADFSAGGFQARFGDRLSSVLDVSYKKPYAFGARAEASLLGVNVAVENSSRDRDFTNITGLRYRDNSLLVNSLPDEAIVQPVFFDAQTYSEWAIDREWSVSFLGTWSSNEYTNEPVNRQTTFGTLAEPRALFVEYNGREENRYQTSLGAIQLRFSPNPALSVQGGFTVFHTYEEEYSDLLASYRIGSLETDITGEGETPGDPLGVGQSYNRSRNQLDALILNIFHRGQFRAGQANWHWGLKFQSEDFRDLFDESEFLFESGVAVRDESGPNNNTEPAEPFTEDITPIFAVNARNDVRTLRFMGFVQWARQWDMPSGTAYVNLGLRSQTWKADANGFPGNRQWVVSPRMQVSYKPKGNKDVVWKAAAGNYQQPPFYRELRDSQGEIDTSVLAQNSWHFTLGHDWSFLWHGRPFRLSGEVYYKTLNRVNAYTVNDMRIRYRADNLTTAYAAGLDLRLSGAFVPGTQSWLSLGILSTQENIEGRGYIPRPTDQRIKLGLLFQDYIPQFPELRVYLNLIYQTGVPGGAPRNSDPYDYPGRLRDYRRADLGISYIFDLPKHEDPGDPSWATVKSLQLGLELFNMFNNQNSITNTWLRDVKTLEQVAIPNFLTSRLLNLKMKIRL